jgi:hypothetical protein
MPARFYLEIRRRCNFCHSLVDILWKLVPDLVQSRVFSVGQLWEGNWRDYRDPT